LIGAFALLFAAAGYGPVVVVAPEGPPSAEIAWIGEAVADALPRDLGLLSVPAVDRVDLARALEKLGIPGAPVTRASAIRVAEALAASRLVTGSYRLEDQQVTLSLRLLDVERATLSAPLISSGPVTRLPELISGLAWDIALAGSNRPQASREEFLAAEPAVPIEALRAYARALSVSDPAVRAKLLRRALALRPAYDEARLSLGRLQLETREHEGARETFARVPASSRVARSARFLGGVALLGLGRYAEAGELYAALVAQLPSAAALNNQGLALLRTGSSSPNASSVLRRAIEMDKNALDLAFNLGFALLTEGQAEAAAFWLKPVVERDANDVRARVVLAWATRAAGRLAQADEIWRQVLARSPSYESMATPDLTRRFERIRDSEGPPARDGDESGELGPAAAHVARGEALAGENQVDEALSELGRAAYLEPTDPRVHLLMARLYLSRGDTEKALASFRMSLWSRDDDGVRLEMDRLSSSQKR
jgi:tetratricopeptide (TPR) repeat protein